MHYSVNQWSLHHITCWCALSPSHCPDRTVESRCTHSEARRPYGGVFAYCGGGSELCLWNCKRSTGEGGPDGGAEAGIEGIRP